MKPVAQRDLTRPCPRCQALRDNRRLLRIAPASPPRRSRQNLHPTKTVPINWQITWHTIPPASINRGSRITPSPSPAARWGSGSAYVFVVGGTSGSNLLSSSGESLANLTFGSAPDRSQPDSNVAGEEFDEVQEMTSAVHG